MKLVKCKSKKDCWKSGNVVLPKVKRKVEGSFFPGKFSSKSSFWTRTTQIGEDCLNVYVRSVKVFCPKCKKKQKNDKLIVFSPKNICPPTKIWTGKMMLLAFLPKKHRSIFEMFKILKKWMKTNWEDFDTVLKQLWENWLNPFVWSAKTSRIKLWKRINSNFQRNLEFNILF